MQIAQWSQDLHSAARALERFLQDDCDFTPIHISAKTALTTKPIVVLGLDQKSLQ